MNPREKNLLVILIAIVGCGAALFIGVQWFWKPLQAYNKTIADLHEDNEKRADELQTFFKQRKKLDVARLKSLPTNAPLAASEYSRFLKTMLTDSGLAVEVIQPSTQATKVKPSPLVPEIKDVGHQTMTFTVRARGELSQLIKLMEQLQKTPYEHRIKELSISRLDTGYGAKTSSRLNINFTMETLLVAKTPAKQGLPPGIDPRLVLAESIASMNAFTARPSGWGMIAAALQLKQETPMPANREYADIGRKNIFVGAICGGHPTAAEKEGPTELKPKDADLLTKPPNENVPAYVRLDTTVSSNHEASLRNLIYDTRPIKLIARKGSGYEFFKITDENRDYIFFQAKVLAVESREVYFQVRDQIFKLGIGESLAQAMRNPLSFEDIIDLELNELYDKEWAKEQMKTPKKKDTGKKTKGGKGR